MSEDPGSIVYITETKNKAAVFSRERMDSMIRDNDFLRWVIEEVKVKKSDAILMKKYLGGIMNLAGATSASDITSLSRRYLHMDEVDQWKLEVGVMGDPFETAKNITAAFPNRKIIVTSTPGEENVSRIWPVLEDSDKRHYFVPCPDCGTFQILKWGGPDKQFGIKYDNHDPNTVYYLCENPKCKAHIPPKEHFWLLTNGHWEKTKPEKINKPGFHIMKLYTTNEWETLVEEWLKAIEFKKRGDYTKLKTFITQSLAELYKPNYDMPKEEDLLSKVEPYFLPGKEILPEKVCFITAYVDVQDSWLHYSVEGWGIGEENWLLYRRKIEGNPALQFVWNELDLELFKPFAHPLGVNLFINAFGVDTGGHNTDQAYEFIKGRITRRLPSGAVQKGIATKGYNTPGKPIAPKDPSFKNKANIPLYFVGTDTAKDVIFKRLELDCEKSYPGISDNEPKAGLLHFNQYYCDHEYFEELTSEKYIVRLQNGIHVPAWELLPGRRNEDLDCKVGNLAVLRIVKANLPKIMESMKQIVEQLKQGSLFDKQQQSEPANSNRRNFATDWNK